MDRLKKFIIGVFVLLFIAIGGFSFWVSGRYVVPIIMYHQVENVDESRPNWVSPENFRWQMDYLKERGYHVISLDELVQATVAGKLLPRKSVVLTFDDGYENNYTAAFKVLKGHGFPATIFMPSDKVGLEGRLKLEQLQEMMAFGIDIGSHTRFEAYLPEVSPQQQRDEIKESKRVLEDQLGRPVDYFAYPIGGFSEGIKDIVREAGYKGACATNRGYDRYNKDVFELNRIRFSDKDIRNDYLWMKLSGYYNLFRKSKHPF